MGARVTGLEQQASNSWLQVPLGTVVHKLVPPETHMEDEEPFTFQQHWVGATDYVSSDDESEAKSSATKQNRDTELEVTTPEQSCGPLDAILLFIWILLLLRNPHMLRIP